MRKSPILSFVTDDAFREAVHAIARTERKSISSWLRDAAKQHMATREEGVGYQYPVYTVDMIGEDPLWSHKEALRR